ncbi:hypothetical protein MRX96_042324 [Rhipicephalus microplus]
MPRTLETTHVLDHSLRFHHQINNKRTVEKTIKTGETNSSPARRPGWETPTSTFPEFRICSLRRPLPVSPPFRKHVRSWRRKRTSVSHPEVRRLRDNECARGSVF